nr:3-hydroxyacyl-coa dehydrogenase type-2 [Quercus suber]
MNLPQYFRYTAKHFLIVNFEPNDSLATVRDLHARGGYIAILDLNAESGTQIAKELGDRAKFFEADMSSPPSVKKAVDGMVAWLQETGKPIGAVIPAAGVGFPGKLIDRNNEPIALEKIDLVLNINLRGVMDLIRLCLPHMTKTEPTQGDGERGVIVMVASSAAYDGQPGQAAYAASKGGIRALTLVLARDLAMYGIRAVSIAPSYFESNMTAAMSEKVRKSLERVLEFPKRPGKGEDFALCVRQCVENVMLNGECIRLDGATRMPSRM